MKRDIYNAIDVALNESKKSGMRCTHGAVILDKNNKIISKGYNENKENHIHNLHAEVSALNKIPPRRRRHLTMIVIRKERNNDNLTISKPCNKCSIILQKFGVKVFYSV